MNYLNGGPWKLVDEFTEVESGNSNADCGEAGAAELDAAPLGGGKGGLGALRDWRHRPRPDRSWRQNCPDWSDVLT